MAGVGWCQSSQQATSLTSQLPTPTSQCLPVTFQQSVKRSPGPTYQQLDSERHGALFKGNISHQDSLSDDENYNQDKSR